MAIVGHLHADSALRSAHESNTVEWRRWNADTLAEAKSGDKPIFFFAAYFGNSLARAMLNETFQNQTIASELNDKTIPVLIDANEQPEISSFLALLAFEHFDASGLPTCLWTDSSLAPLNGGSYFPPTDDWGSQGFLSVTRNVSEQWQARNESYLQTAKQRLADTLSTNSSTLPELSALANTFAVKTLSNEDAPSLKALELYNYTKTLDHFPHDRASEIHNAVTGHLETIIRGAGFDSISGGFFIGSNDPNWKLPLFQKSTVDQALMLAVLAELHSRDPKNEYIDLIRLTAQFVNHDLQKTNGLAIQYLDSIGSEESIDTPEGTYYLIDVQEVSSLPTESLNAWGLKPEGNLDSEADILGIYEGINVPFAHDPEVLSPAYDTLRSPLLAIRANKSKPQSDESGYTFTNALLASSLAKAGHATGNQAYIDQANAILQSVLSNNYDKKSSKLYNSDSRSTLASSQDYAFLIATCLELGSEEAKNDNLDAASEILSIWQKDPRFPSTNPIARSLERGETTAAIYLDTTVPSVAAVHLENIRRLQDLGSISDSDARQSAILSDLPQIVTKSPERFRSLILATKRSQVQK